jgi:hypothetical protein
MSAAALSAEPGRTSPSTELASSAARRRFFFGGGGGGASGTTAPAAETAGVSAAAKILSRSRRTLFLLPDSDREE